MNKKGFTLIELLAAITVLALLALITIPAVTKPIKESKQELYESQLRSFKDSAKSWSADNMFSKLPDKGSCLLIALSTLINEGLVEPNIKSSLDGKIFSGEIQNNKINGVFIKIDNQGTTSNQYIYNVYNCSNEKCFNPDTKEYQAYTTAASGCTIYQE